VRKSGKYYRLHSPLPEVTWNRVAEADRLIVYSLSPERSSGSEGCDRLHEYPILSQVDVVDSRTAQVYSSLRAGEEVGTLGMRCFIPRHGVRAIRGHIVLDLVICFECTNMAVFESSGSEIFMWADISQNPQALLDELLGIAHADEDIETPDEHVSWRDLSEDL